MDNMNEKLRARLKNIKAIVANVSGVLNNNQDLMLPVPIYYPIRHGLFPQNVLGFTRSHYDGQGVSLLRAIGIDIAFIHVDPFNSDDPVTKLVQRWNNLPSANSADRPWPQVKLINGVIEKEQIEPVESWLGSLVIGFDECVVMGHDLVPYHLMKYAKDRGSVLVAPSGAEQIVKSICHWVTPRDGGNGCLRDLANVIIEAKGIDPTALPTS